MRDSTRRKLDYLDVTKQRIKDALIDKGQEVSEFDTFRSYAEKVSQISGGRRSNYSGRI